MDWACWGKSSFFCLPGRCCIGTAAATMVYAPFTMPEAPKPDMARPMTNASLVGANPHRNEPASNRPKNARKVY